MEKGILRSKEQRTSRDVTRPMDDDDDDDDDGWKWFDDTVLDSTGREGQPRWTHAGGV